MNRLMTDHAHTVVEAPLYDLVPSKAKAPPVAPQSSPLHLSSYPRRPPARAVVPQEEGPTEGSADSDSTAVVVPPCLMRALEALSTFVQWSSLTA